MIRPATNAADCYARAATLDRWAKVCLNANQLNQAEQCRIEAAEYERMAIEAEAEPAKVAS